MTVSRLSSKDNPLLKTIRLVASGARRAPTHLVAAEGIRVLEEVEHSGARIEAVVISEDFGVSPRERSLLNRWMGSGPPVYQVHAALFQSISTVETPQGAIALVNVPDVSLESAPSEPNALILLACAVQDPGNLGTLIRTAAAAGASLIATTPGTVSARNPKVIRSSAGAFFRLPLAEHVEPREFRNYCEQRSIRIFRTDACMGTIHTEADLASPSAILLGNEGGGISDNLFSDVPSIRIPMAPGVESLNVAAAGAILLFEAQRQRGIRAESKLDI